MFLKHIYSPECLSTASEMLKHQISVQNVSFMVVEIHFHLIFTTLKSPHVMQEFLVKSRNPRRSVLDSGFVYIVAKVRLTC